MFTIYNEEENRNQLVEEPDPSYTYTYADYVKWKFLERLELFRGKIFKMAAPNRTHQSILGFLHAEFYNFLKKQPCKVFLSPFDVRLPKGNRIADDQITTVVQPDLIVVCDPSKLELRGCLGTPDLAVEILSPSHGKQEMRIKFELYEEAGVREYWIIDPQKRTVLVNLLGKSGVYNRARVYTQSDRLSSTVIPGFEIQDVSEIFEE